MPTQWGMLMAMVVATSSCATPGASPEDSRDRDFAHALSVCRFQHTGATNQKVALEVTEEHIAKCLARRGWQPSGERLPDGDDSP